MASVLDNVDVILASGDLEVFRQWIEAKLESKDKQIAHLLHRIQNLEKEIDILKCIKFDKGQFEYEMTMRYEN